MALPRIVVDIAETDTEYLLSIHAAQKDRAKAIAGYRWDAERVRWVYPRTARVYDALLAEFGDDIVGAPKITRPGKALTDPPVEARAENHALQQEMGKLREKLEQISGVAVNGQALQVQALEAALAARESAVAEIKRRADELEKQLQQNLTARQHLWSENERLRAVNSALRVQAATQSTAGTDATTDFENRLRETAKDATGREAKFCALVDRLQLNESLPIDLAKELMRELRRIVKCHDRTATPHDLLVRARDMGVLTERGIDLAHVIRKERNVTAHESTDKRSQPAQMLLCLFAAALLWPEFG